MLFAVARLSGNVIRRQSRFANTDSSTTLWNLRPNKGATSTQKRLGRGRSSGLGKTSGRGHKGQKARSGNGKPKPGFEGGQTPITKLIPKRGFINRNSREFASVNLDRIVYWIAQGRLSSSPEVPITARELLLSGCIHNVHDGVTILASGSEQLKQPIHIVASRASKTAVKAIEAAGGTVFCQYYNRLALRDCVKGRTDRISAAPVVRKDIMWYTKWSNRGYLAPESLDVMPNVPERWRELSRQLLVYKDQGFAPAKKRK
ncbi:ribosomal protein L15 [Vararia minispora EC-137]|uniref:Ribosomal protein L15 n=1 Tax=Vararia minispora EC-137 TaxID=1314806 RepID=A0ACB8QD48_9AGAM|nr:ribosomal protein L15 [Vararia minispora EC-137]